MKSKDITDCLNNDQFNRLIELATEDDYKDVVSLQEFRAATENWRTTGNSNKYPYNTKSNPSKNPY